MHDHAMKSSSFSDDDEVPPLVLGGASSSTGCAQPEPEVMGDCNLKLEARVEYSALPSGMTQDIFGLITLEAGASQVQDTGGQESRQPMDIVCVLDVSDSMRGNKIRQVQSAVRFIIEQASSNDRLSIVTFHDDAARILRLRKMDKYGKDDAIRATLMIQTRGGTSIGAGLHQAISIMEQRRQRNVVSALLLLTDGMDYCVKNRVGSLLSRVTDARCSLYCFGFGANHDAGLLSSISELAHTPFTYVEKVEDIREAFAGTIGGLSSVAGQNLRLSINAFVPLTSVNTPFQVQRIGEAEAVVTIPDIMAEERRDVLVQLSVPADESGRVVLLQAAVVYLDLEHGAEVQTPIVTMETQRSDEPQPEMEPDEEVSTQRERFEVAQALREAAKHSDEGQYESARRVIGSMEQRVLEKRTKNCTAMRQELQGAITRMSDTSAWEHGGRAETYDTMQMHSMQRCTNVIGTSGPDSRKMSKYFYTNKKQIGMIAKSKKS